MSNIIKFEDISDKSIRLRGKDVILDFEVVALHGIQTKEVNQAVKNNPRKFPKSYVLAMQR
ncbi:MAG: ORF6N domain-containing protein [Prevotella sp.]|nr:ORF6N domain-containing protein [Prevotella sp.]